MSEEELQAMIDEVSQVARHINTASHFLERRIIEEKYQHNILTCSPQFDRDQDGEINEEEFTYIMAQSNND